MKLKHSKLTHFQSNKLLEHFVGGASSRTAADLTKVHYHTARQFYHKIREIIVFGIEEEQKSFDPDDWGFSGEVEVDESYFGAKRKGKRGRGAADKVAVFGILKRGGHVYTQIILDAKRDTLIPIICNKIRPQSIVYTDCWQAYNTLSVAGFKHFRINHSTHFSEPFGGQANHINGIENFWSQAKRHMRKFNGIPKEHFHLFLKECEFRFNYGTPNNQLTTIKKWVKLYNKT